MNYISVGNIQRGQIYLLASNTILFNVFFAPWGFRLMDNDMLCHLL